MLYVSTTLADCHFWQHFVSEFINPFKKANGKRNAVLRPIC
jgi:hypothetical protein